MISCGGIRFSIHPLLWMIIGSSVLTGYFLEVITLFSIVLVHELGHVAAALALGWKVKDVKLLPFGGVAEVEHTRNPTPLEECLVALAGPLQNVLMIASVTVLRWVGSVEPEWSEFFISANMMIALFNLIPVLPLDGGRLLQALLTTSISYHRALLTVSWISLGGSVAVIILSLLWRDESGLMLNGLVIGCFLLYDNFYSYRNLPFRFLRFLMKREEETRRLLDRGVHVRPIAVGQNQGIRHIVKLLMLNRYHCIYVFNEEGRIASIVPEQRIVSACFEPPNQ